ncbi:MAG: hypothetical protein ABI240_04665 [Sphingomonas sp.]
MATKRLLMSGRAGMFAQRHPRAAIGGSGLACVMIAELIAVTMLGVGL